MGYKQSPSNQNYEASSRLHSAKDLQSTSAAVFQKPNFKKRGGLWLIIGLIFLFFVFTVLVLPKKIKRESSSAQGESLSNKVERQLKTEEVEPEVFYHKLPFPIIRQKTVPNMSNWKEYKHSSGYTFYYPTGWFTTKGQVQTWDPDKVAFPGAGIAGEDAKWDISFTEEEFKSLEEAIYNADASPEYEYIEVSTTNKGWPVYFAYHKTADYSYSTPYLIGLVYTPEGKVITWHGFVGTENSPNFEVLKQIVGSIEKAPSNSKEE